MLGRMLKNDFKKNPTILGILILFVMLAAFLVATGVGVITELTGAMKQFEEKAGIPHFVQMHKGEVNVEVLQEFAKANAKVQSGQLVSMLNLEGRNVLIGPERVTQEGSVMDIGFVVQNTTFDFLLDMNNNVLQVEQGQIAVPLYYKQQYDLKIGDPIVVTDGSFTKTFVISDFLRDIQMNYSVVTSKRFLIHKEDYRQLSNHLGELEYLIEFRLQDPGAVGNFTAEYRAAGMPAVGPTIEYKLLKIMNALTDGITVVVLLLVSGILIGIAMLCLRFMILTALEEDYKEIGVLKAIGVSMKHIKKLYLRKYQMITGIGCILGFLGAVVFRKAFIGSIQLYTGGAQQSLWRVLLPLLGVTLMFGVVVALCKKMLRVVGKVSAVAALRDGALMGAKGTRGMELAKSRLPVTFYLALKDLKVRWKMFSLPIVIYGLCTFMMILPINLLYTVKSPSFMTYMGAPRSDLRIDLQNAGAMGQEVSDMKTYMEKDKDIKAFETYITYSMKTVDAQGETQGLYVEIGDFNKFPLTYLEGRKPIDTNEMALSYLNAKELQVKVGDELSVEGGQTGSHQVKVCGIYQDVTNGGKTAKAVLDLKKESGVWYIMHIALKDKVNLQDKVAEYKQVFKTGKITDTTDYLQQTMGGMLGKMEKMILVMGCIAVTMMILITILFGRLIFAKDQGEISVLKSMGFGKEQIRMQYYYRFIVSAAVGVVGAFMVTVILGERLVSLFFAGMGAARIHLMTDVIKVYGVVPLLVMVLVGASSWIVSKRGVEDKGVVK